MSKSARPRSPAASRSAPSGEPVPVVGAREPCPCGSGRRYKACHGKASARARTVLVQRPFAGMRSECDLVAMREFVPAASAALTLTGSAVDRQAQAVTVLPMAVPALTRSHGQVLVAMQTQVPANDASRQVAAALTAGLAASPGSTVDAAEITESTPRLQDVVDPEAAIEVSVHDGFEFWVENPEEMTAEVRASLEQADAAAPPTARLSSVTAAYWSNERDKAFVRWVMPQEEPELLDALARLHAARADDLGDTTRYVGSFRCHGLLAPVWEVPTDAPAETYEKPAADFATRLDEALHDTTPLDDEQRRARRGLANRQLTIR